jgi:quercetin dioxygenase-like cupin family protein
MRMGVVPSAWRERGANEVQVQASVVPFQLREDDGRLVAEPGAPSEVEELLAGLAPAADVWRDVEVEGGGRNPRPPADHDEGKSPGLRVRPLARRAPGGLPRRLGGIPHRRPERPEIHRCKETPRVSLGEKTGALVVRAGEGSPWHIHPDEDEWFYVLEGEFTFYVGDERLSLPTGSFAFGPKGVPHTFIAESDGAKALVGFPTLPLRGLPARGRRTGSRAGTPTAARGSPGHGAPAPDRRAQRDGDPRAPRPTPRPLIGTSGRRIMSRRKRL